MAKQVPIIQLNDGKMIPQLGFGVWQVKNDEVVEPVLEAIRTGYRLIDTAAGYGNEDGVGKAIQQCGIDRNELFVTTKLNNPDQGFDQAMRAFDESLAKLKLDVLDLYLIHWPLPMYDNYVDTWKAFIRLKEEGKVHSIGVSNFLPEHLERIIGETGVTPVINQIELHPQFQQKDIRDFNTKHNIQLEAYSPLGSGAVLKNKTIEDIAKRYSKSVAQIIVRWHIQQGTVVIPKSVTPERIRENFEVFDFELSADDMAHIEALDDPQNGRTGSDPKTFDWKG